VEQDEEARDASLDDLLDDDVGRVEAALGTRGGRVLDLHDEEGTFEDVRIDGESGERRERSPVRCEVGSVVG